MLYVILNRPWKQHHIKQQLYGHLPPFLHTIQVRQARHARYRWRTKDELISDILQGIPTQTTNVIQTTKAYICQLCTVGECFLDLSIGMDRERQSREYKLLPFLNDDTQMYQNKCLYCCNHNILLIVLHFFRCPSLSGIFWEIWGRLLLTVHSERVIHTS